jgi:hypothetical protein
MHQVLWSTPDGQPSESYQLGMQFQQSEIEGVIIASFRERTRELWYHGFDNYMNHGNEHWLSVRMMF